MAAGYSINQLAACLAPLLSLCWGLASNNSMLAERRATCSREVSTTVVSPLKVCAYACSTQVLSLFFLFSISCFLACVCVSVWTRTWTHTPWLINHTLWCQHLHVCLPDGDMCSFICFVNHSFFIFFLALLSAWHSLDVGWCFWPVWCMCMVRSYVGRHFTENQSIKKKKTFSFFWVTERAVSLLKSTVRSHFSCKEKGRFWVALALNHFGALPSLSPHV